MASEHFDAVRERVSAALEAALDGPPAEHVGPVRSALSPHSDAAGDADGTSAPAEPTEAERMTLELVIRMFLDGLLTRAKKAKQTIVAAKVPELLDLTLELTRQGVTEYNTTFALLEDIFDSQVISQLELVFSLLEQRASQLCPFLEMSNPKCTRSRLTLIRSCNELLRRLSKSKNTNLCGRVLLLMAYALPLCERSGVNLKGLTAKSHLVLAEAAEEEEATVASAAPAGGAADFEFYTSFWGLQKSFSEPASVRGAEAWAELVKRLEAALQVFASFGEGEAGGAGEAEAEAEAGTEAEAGADAGEAMEAEGSAPQDELQEVYFAKFLTSPKLIQLQLRDTYFRRHLLVQVLIFLQTVSSEGKGQLSAAQAGQAALSAAQAEQVEALQQRCKELLSAIAPAGSTFGKSVSTMLAREAQWLEWKRAGCKPFDKIAAERRQAAVAKRKRVAPKVQVGNSELTRLWNLGDNSLESLASFKQNVPSLAEYLKPVIDQMDPEAGVEEEYKLKNDKVFTWKALRLMAKKDVSLLAKVSQPGGSLEVAVEHMQKRLKEDAKEDEDEDEDKDEAGASATAK